MSKNIQNPVPVSPSARRARRLRIAGVIVLFLGLLGIGTVYWLAIRSGNASDNAMELGYYKSEQLQLQKMYGHQGELMADIYSAFQQPGAQAILIALATALISGGCFFFACLPEHKKSGSPPSQRRHFEITA